METLGKGAIRDSYDIRDYHFAPAGAFDWQKGFDIEVVIGFKLDTKDQNGSSSCGGQAWAYYGEVLEAIATGTYEPRSARWIYSHTWAPGGGSHGRDNCAHVIKKGFALERDATSYENGKPPQEGFMRVIPQLSAEGNERRDVSRALSYLQVEADIDLIATAVAQNHGCIIATWGQDNGTWRTKFPKAPKKRVWAHWLYVGKAKTINGKKYIGVKNSWGDDTGEGGWQWLGEEFFDTGAVWYGYTLAWDYKPAKVKVLLKEVIKLLQSVLSLHTKK